MKVSSEFSALRKLQDDYGHDHVREETSQIDIGAVGPVPPDAP